MPTEDSARPPPRRQLLLDVAAVVLLLLLDARDLWFKLRWVGSRDNFAFSTTKTLELSHTTVLEPTNAFSFADQRVQRASGWSSFLQKCESMTAIHSAEETETSYVLGKNCLVGEGNGAVRVQDLVLTSSIRSDSVAWAACELLYKHRKPPICRLPIVTRFRDRYNIYIDDKSPPSQRSRQKPLAQELELVQPGSEDETDLIELLSVISKSAPVSSVVCVEGFAIKGAGRHPATIYGCGSPSFFQSAFAGGDAANSFVRLLQDKAWLTSDALHIMGVRLLVRENRRCVLVVNDTAGGTKSINHVSWINFSVSGSLYTAMILLDLVLLAIGVCSAVEIALRILWPLWKPLIVTEYQIPSSRTTKLGYALEDFSRVLPSSLLRSTPIALMTAMSRLLSWMLIIPCNVVWTDTNSDIGDIHTLLTMLRVSDLVLLSVNSIWNIGVVFGENFALAVARRTYVSALEVTTIFSVVMVWIIFVSSFYTLDEVRLYEHQRVIDRSSFVNITVYANTFPAQQDSKTNTSLSMLGAIYGQLHVIISATMLFVGLLATLRFIAGRSSISGNLLQCPKSSTYVVQPSAADDESAIPLKTNDLTSSSAGILMRLTPPLPSPTRESMKTPSTDSFSESDTSDGRLLVEDMVDTPIRARSFVRQSWVLEKLGTELLLPPSLYLEHGVILEGRYIRTRCGFVGVAQPLVHAEEHTTRLEAENDEQDRAKQTHGRS